MVRNRILQPFSNSQKLTNWGWVILPTKPKASVGVSRPLKVFWHLLSRFIFLTQTFLIYSCFNQGGGGGKVLAFLGSILRLSNVSSTAGSPTSNGFIHTTHNPGNCK